MFLFGRSIVVILHNLTFIIDVYYAKLLKTDVILTFRHFHLHLQIIFAGVFGQCLVRGWSDFVHVIHVIPQVLRSALTQNIHDTLPIDDRQATKCLNFSRNKLSGKDRGTEGH